jgi:CHAT domain-containing protein/predicted negative regulator of RcsB-dependent stress response
MLFKTFINRQSINIILCLISICNAYGQTAEEFRKIDSLIINSSFGKAESIIQSHFKKTQDVEQSVQLFLHLARIKVKRRQFDEAGLFLEKAEKNLSLLNQPRLFADLKFIRGTLLYERFRSEQSLANFTSAANLYLRLLGPDHPVVAICKRQIGNVYAHQYFQYDIALQYYEAAKIVLEKNKVSRYKPELIALYFDLARLYQNKEELQTSLYYVSEAELFYNDKNEWLPQLADCKNLRAIDKIYRGDLKQAIEIEQEAILLCQKKEGKEARLTGKYYDNLGTIYLGLNDKKTALAYYKKGLRINLKHAFNEYMISSSYLNLGALYTTMKNDSANMFLIKAFNNTKQLFGEHHFETASIYLHLGEFHYSNKKYDSALSFYQKSLKALLPSFNPRQISSTPKTLPSAFSVSFFWVLERKAEAFLNRGRENNNLDDFKHALNTVLISDSLINISLKAIENDDSKFFLKNNLQNLYEIGIKCAYELYGLTKSKEYLEYCFKLMENSKFNVVLNDLLATFSRSEFYDSVKTLKILNSQLNLEIYLAENKRDFKTVKILKEKLQQQRQLFVRIQNKYLKNSITPATMHEPSIARTLEYLKANDTDLIEFFWGKKEIFAFYINGDSLRLKSIPVTESLTNQLRKIRGIISNPVRIDSLEHDAYTFRQTSGSLYHTLLGGLTFRKKILVIPDGPLSLLPFEVLITEEANASKNNFRDLPYLIRNHILRYGYSISILQLFTERYPRELSSKILMVSVLDTLKKDKTDLPHNFQLLTSGNNIKSDFVQNTQNASVIHFEAHSYVDDQNPLNSYIALNETDASNFLRLYEIYKLNLHAEVTILATCESNVGKYTNGEGMYSIARAFMTAGSKGIITSLWKIPDHFTGTITKDFYNYFPDNDGAEALQQSKLSFLNSSDQLKAHPYNWSGLIFLGQETIDNSSGKLYAYLFGSAILVLLILARYRWRKLFA